MPAITEGRAVFTEGSELKLSPILEIEPVSVRIGGGGSIVFSGSVSRSSGCGACSGCDLGCSGSSFCCGSGFGCFH